MKISKKLRVHLLSPPDPHEISLLQHELDPRIAITSGLELPQPADYHILVAGRPDRRFLEASPNLHSLLIPFAGLPDSTRQLMLEFPEITVHNLHYNATATAEMAVALLLAAAKHLLPMDRALRSGDWRPRYEPLPSMMLHGKTALILGYGSIGRQVGQVLEALGVRVLGVRRHPQSEAESGIPVFGLESLLKLLPQVQLLLVCLPLTAETEGLLDAAALALLPPGAILVNVGRGAVVDQYALYQALKSRRLQAAGLDVWYNYPPNAEGRANTPPADYPFHELDNLVMSPHRASAVAESEELRMCFLAQALNQAACGDGLPHAVDLQAGY